MSSPNVEADRGSGGFRVALAAGVLFWIVVVGVFAASSGESDAAINAAYVVSVVLAAIGFAAAVRGSGGAERVFWTLLGCGLAARVAGTVIWEHGSLGFGAPANHLLAYCVSYVLLFGAMAWLLVSAREKSAPVAMLDAAGTMTAFGVLALYIVASPVVSVVDFDGWRDLSWILSRPVCDLGFLFLAMTAFRVRARPGFLAPVSFGFLLFVIADALYLRLRIHGPYEFGHAPELFWAGGVMLIGLAAFRRSEFGFAPKNRRPDSFSFWPGVLLPPLLYACALVWSAFNRPIPDYILFGGIAVMILITLRMSFIARLNRRLGLENEELARQNERALLSEELHDGLKQRLHGLLLATRAVGDFLDKNDAESARRAASDAVDIAGDAHRRLSRPIAELGFLARTEEFAPTRLLEQTFEDVRRCFRGLEIADDFHPAVERLTPEEFAAAYRVIGEALWNAVKHSGAKKVRVEARLVGNLLLVNVRDDGRGFDESVHSDGMGIPLMRERARRVGAKLEIYTSPKRGTTVQTRFER